MKDGTNDPSVPKEPVVKEPATEQTGQPAVEAPAAGPAADSDAGPEAAPKAERSGLFWATLLGFALVLSLLANAYQYQRNQRLDAALAASAESTRGVRGDLETRDRALGELRKDADALRERLGSLGPVAGTLRSAADELDALASATGGPEGRSDDE